MTNFQPLQMSVKDFKEYLSKRVETLNSPMSSNWSYSFIVSKDIVPQMAIVGLLTSSSMNGKLKIEDDTGNITCVISGPTTSENCINLLEPISLDQRIKITNFLFVMEQFCIATYMCRKTYVVCNYCDIIYMHPRMKSGNINDQCISASGYSSETSICMHDAESKHAYLPLHSVSQAGRSSLNTEELSLSTTVTDRCKISETVYLIFYCLAKSGLYYRHNDGYSFHIYCSVIRVTDACAKDESEAFTHGDISSVYNVGSNQHGKVHNDQLDSLQLVFVAPALKWYHTIHQECVYKLGLPTDDFNALKSSVAERLMLSACVLQVQNVKELRCLDRSLYFENPSTSKWHERVINDIPRVKIFSVSEAVQQSSFFELVSVYGIICERSQCKENNCTLFSNLAREKFVTLDVGMIENSEIALEICDTSNASITTRIFLNNANIAYPFGLLPGASVMITLLDGHISKTNCVYFRSTVITNIEILAISPGGLTASTMNSVPLLTDYMESERLLLSERIIKCRTLSAHKFSCLAEVQNVLEIALKLLCPGCQHHISVGQKCTFVGCHSSSPPIDDSRSSLWVSDGSARVIAKFKGDDVRKILRISENCWQSLLNSTESDKTFKRSFMQDPNLQSESLIMQILCCAAQNPDISRTVLMELKWNPAYNVRNSSEEQNGRPAVLLCTRFEEISPLSAVACVLRT